jgi:hypothetical protein
VIFHSYVKLPEGKFPGSGQRNSIDFDQNLGKCYSWTHPQAPNEAPNGSKWHRVLPRVEVAAEKTLVLSI